MAIPISLPPPATTVRVRSAYVREEYLAMALRELMEQLTRQGWKLLVILNGHGGNDQEQRENLRTSLQSLLRQKRLTEDQSQLLEQIAEALEKKRTSLQGEEASHEQPHRERPHGGAHNG